MASGDSSHSQPERPLRSAQALDGEAGEPTGPGRALRLRRLYDFVAMDHLPGATDADLAGAQVDVGPLEAARLAAPQPEGYRADCDRLALVSPQRAEVGTDLARLHRAWAVRRLVR